MLSFVTTAILSGVTLADAQGDERVAVRGSLGWGQVWGDESSLGTGPSVTGGLKLRPLRRWGLELELTRYSHLRSFDSGVRFSGEGTIVSGNIVYHFSGARAQPFVLGGVVTRQLGPSKSVSCIRRLVALGI